jgi:hypothetical protein
MGRSFLILAALLAGCTMGHERVDGWPALQVVEHYVPHAEMRERCARYAGFGMSPEACAEFDLAAARCHIWYSADFPPPRFVRDHERLHCAGYDHVGSASMQQILKRHLASRWARFGITRPAASPKPMRTESWL